MGAEAEPLEDPVSSAAAIAVARISQLLSAEGRALLSLLAEPDGELDQVIGMDEQHQGHCGGCSYRIVAARNAMS